MVDPSRAPRGALMGNGFCKHIRPTTNSCRELFGVIGSGPSCSRIGCVETCLVAIRRLYESRVIAMYDILAWRSSSCIAECKV